MDLLQNFLRGSEREMTDEDLGLCVDALERAIVARATLEALGMEGASIDDLKSYKNIFEGEMSRRETDRALEDWRRAQDLIGEAIR